MSGYACVDISGDAKCPGALGGTVTLAPGDDITCTITNDDMAPSLTLVKEVTNNSGGSAVPAEWTLTATGPSTFFGPGPSVSNPENFEAGSYVLSESNGPVSYTASAWVCEGGGTLDDDTITLALDESATCTITNDDDVITEVIFSDGFEQN